MDGVEADQVTGAVGGGGEQAREGTFCLFAMVHTLGFVAPDGTRDTVPWDGRTPGGPFSYASKPCSAEAPVNNVSSDLPVLGGVLEHGRVPASTRTHPLRFAVSRASGATVLRGTISLVVCQLGPGSTTEAVADVDRPRIEVTWRAPAQRCGARLVTFQGTFAVMGGTGPYRSLQGAGDIGGYFYTADPEAPAGVLLDAQYGLLGRYRLAEGPASEAGRPP